MMDPTAFLDDFRAEAGEHLRTLDAQLLRLERDPSDPRPVREMFLSAHSIKGAAAMLGLADIRAVAHALEDVLGSLRDEHRPLDAETADLLFRAVDVLRERVGRSRPGAAEPDASVAELVAALRQRTSRPEPPAAPVSKPALPTAAPRVLLVEDSPTMRLLETMLLSEAGFQVDAVADGQHALVQALATPYDLVITGLEIQGLRGLELAAALRQSPSRRDLPIIVLSSNDNPAHRQSAAEVGAEVCIRTGALDQSRLVERARALVARS